MNTFFQTLTFWHWFGLCVLLVILDVALGVNFVLLWSGLAAGVVGLFLWAFPNMGWEWQFATFGIGVFLSLAFWRYHLKSTSRESDRPHLNQRAHQYIGRTIYLDVAIVQSQGKVRIDDTSWRVSGEDMPKGTQVRVIAVEGMVLQVEKV